MAGPGPKVLRCWASRQRVRGDWLACALWEGPLSCLDCGACCAEAYDAVEVSQRDPVRRLQPDYIVRIEGRYQVRRTAGNRCAALGDDNRCAIYSDRPRCCRAFERHGENCLFARRRLGFSKAR